MKIQGRKNRQVGSLGPLNMPVHHEAAPVKEQAPAVEGDMVELGRANELRVLREAVQAMPSVRADRVESIRGAIEDGSYHVASEKLARKVIHETLSEALMSQLGGKRAF